MASVWKRGGEEENPNGAWYITWRDETGRHRSQSSHTTDKAAALQLAQQLEGRTEAVRQAYTAAATKPTPTELAEQFRLLPKHVQRILRVNQYPTLGQCWAPWEDELLQSNSDSEVAEQTGRTIASIVSRRSKLGSGIDQAESLAEIANAWPILPAAVREALVTIVKAFQPTETPSDAALQGAAELPADETQILGPFATPLPEADFNQLVADNYAVLLGKARQLIDDPHNAEDVLQDALQKFWSYRQRKPARRNERGLMFAILRSKIAAYHGRREHAATLDVDADAATGKAYFDARKA